MFGITWTRYGVKPLKRWKQIFFNFNADTILELKGWPLTLLETETKI